jgi:hypothetical protein
MDAWRFPVALLYSAHAQFLSTIEQKFISASSDMIIIKKVD